MKILIIRHGDPDYENDTLTEKGHKEAEYLAERLIKYPIKDVYCSPLGRAKATAEHYLNKVNKEMTVLPWLREFSGTIIRPDTKQEGYCWDFMPKVWSSDEKLFSKLTWLESDIMKTGTAKKVYEETISGIDSLLLSYGYKRDGYIYKAENNTRDTIAIFCHYAMGMTILSHFTGISPSLLWQTMFLPPTSVTTLVTEERVKGEVIFKCKQMGDSSHLYVKGEEPSNSGLYNEIYSETSIDGAKLSHEL